jgi:ribosomal protein L32
MSDKPLPENAKSDAQVCSVCGHRNRAGILLCENCGASLVKAVGAVVDTRNLMQQAAKADLPPTPPELPKTPPSIPTADLTNVIATLDSMNNPPEPGNKQKCPNCGQLNRPGVLLCENCGTNLATGETRIGTRDFHREKVDEHETLPPERTSLDTNEMKAVITAGTGIFENDMVLRLEVEGAPTPILVYPTLETVMGRRDPVTGSLPDVDLTAYAGYRMGVSRKHAVIRLQNKQLDLRDLGSSNGTFVNGVRLTAHQPHALRDGDEIALGKMVLKVFFQAGVKRR